MKLGDLVSCIVDIVAETVITGHIVSIGRNVVIVEDAQGTREAVNKLNVKRV